MAFDEKWLADYAQRTGCGYTEAGKHHGAPSTGKSMKRKGQPTLELQQPAGWQLETAPAVAGKKKNKTEQRFERDFLVPAKLAGDLEDYKFERIKLILGDGTTYTPDFFGKWANGVLQFWEIKGGYIHEDARVKFNAAAEQYQEFAFSLHQWKGGEWRTLKRIRC